MLFKNLGVDEISQAWGFGEEEKRLYSLSWRTPSFQNLIEEDELAIDMERRKICRVCCPEHHWKGRLQGKSPSYCWKVKKSKVEKFPWIWQSYLMQIVEAKVRHSEELGVFSGGEEKKGGWPYLCCKTNEFLNITRFFFLYLFVCYSFCME